jgi:hypothetical protein
MMEAGAPVVTTHAQLLVAQAKRDAKKEELRRVHVERAAVRARCAAVEAELYELEGQARSWYAQEAVERMQAHPGEVAVQRDGCAVCDTSILVSQTVVRSAPGRSR